MKNFWKNNSYIVFKLVLNEFGMIMFGMITGFAAQKSQFFSLLCGILATLLYCFLFYTVCWEVGAKDKIKVDGKRAQPTPLKGLWLFVFSNALHIFALILFLVTYFAASDNAAFVIRAVELILNGMYLPFAFIPGGLSDTPAFFALALLPALITCTLSYYLGFSGRKYILPASKDEKK